MFPTADIKSRRKSGKLELIVSKDFFQVGTNNKKRRRNDLHKFYLQGANNCTWQIEVKHPCQLVVLGGSHNHYQIIGSRKVLNKTYIKFLGGSKNYFPQGISPENIEYKSGVIED